MSPFAVLIIRFQSVNLAVDQVVNSVNRLEYACLSSSVAFLSEVARLNVLSIELANDG